MPKFIIQDWAGNHCFPDKEFKTFEDAWEFLYEQFPDASDQEEVLGEFYVIERE